MKRIKQLIANLAQRDTLGAQIYAQVLNYHLGEIRICVAWARQSPVSRANMLRRARENAKEFRSTVQSLRVGEAHYQSLKWVLNRLSK